MNRKIALVSAVALALASTAALADDMYAGIGYGQAKIDTGGFGNAKPSVAFGNFGYQVNSNFAIEGRLGAGVSDDSVNVGGIPVKVKVDHYLGLYMKGILPLNDSVGLYAIAGASDAKATAKSGGASASDSNTEASYGAGMSVAVGSSKSTNLTLEWARLFKDTDAVSVGVSFKF
jgi:hypothetical protein